MSENDGSDSHSSTEEDGRSTHEDGRNGGRDTGRNHPNQIEIQAHDLKVKVQSEDADLERMCELASDEMESVMHHSLRGEMEAIEREELSILGFGGD